MITFKQFLIIEGGKETAKYNTERANALDIKKAIEILSNRLSIPQETLYNQLLGTVNLTLIGKRKDSGDIDIAVPKENMKQYHTKMMVLVDNKGTLNRGTKVGSYALNIGNKKVQVDLMFVDDINWAKFSYYSTYGDKSKYPGSIRTILLATALSYTQEPKKDFIIKDKDGEIIAKASRAYKLDTGIERLFKLRKRDKKTGKWLKGIETVSPETLKAEFGDEVEFDPTPDIIRDPNKVARFIFGNSVSAKDIMYAEQIIELIKTKRSQDAKKILSAAKKSIEEIKQPVPEEILSFLANN